MEQIILITLQSITMEAFLLFRREALSKKSIKATASFGGESGIEIRKYGR